MRRSNFIALFSILLISSGIVVWWFWFRDSDTSEYDTIVVSRGDIILSVTAVGTLQPLQAVEVGTQVSGQIQKLHVLPGSVVEKGQLLIEIDASVHQATVDAGRAALEGLQAQLMEEEAQENLAGQQLARQTLMAREGSTREEDLQIAEAAFATAKARLRQRRAEIVQRESTLKADEAQLGYTRIYAPMSGTVVSVNAKEGQTINSTYQTQTVLRIADLTRMTVWTAVAEADIHRVKPGMKASFTTLSGDERQWEGSVRQILPMPPVTETAKDETAASNSKVIKYTVLFDVDNNDGALMPMMTAQVRIVSISAKNILVAPLAGLTSVENKRDIFQAKVIDGMGKPQTRTLRTGIRDRHSAEILEGLHEGDHILIGEREKDEQRRFVW